MDFDFDGDNDLASNDSFAIITDDEEEEEKENKSQLLNKMKQN